MRTKRNIIAILATFIVGATLCGCSYNELPPKTSDASKREELKAIRAEYEAAVSAAKGK